MYAPRAGRGYAGGAAQFLPQREQVQHLQPQPLWLAQQVVSLLPLSLPELQQGLQHDCSTKLGNVIQPHKHESHIRTYLHKNVIGSLPMTFYAAPRPSVRSIARWIRVFSFRNGAIRRAAHRRKFFVPQLVRRVASFFTHQSHPATSLPRRRGFYSFAFSTSSEKRAFTRP